MNHVYGSVYPNAAVLVGDALLLRTNSLGCKGPELQPGRPVIGFFGDSVVHGGPRSSFVEHVRVGTAQMLNGAVEGYPLRRIVERFQAARSQVDMICAAVHPGWHNLVYGEATQAHWREQLDLIEGPPVIAHFRLTADVNPEAVEIGYEALFAPGRYIRWAGVDLASRDDRRRFWDALQSFNAFIEGYCRERGRLLIDLDPVLAPERYGDIGQRFFDLIHPREAVQAVIGAAISNQLAPSLSPLAGGPAREPEGREAGRSRSETNGAKGGVPDQAYPLW